MAANASEETIQYWQKQVEAFKTSGLTREAYSKENGIRVYQLDYWRRKISRKERTPERIYTNQWMPVNISEEPAAKNSSLDLWIGTVRIEVKPGFDSKLLAEVIHAVGAVC